MGDSKRKGRFRVGRKITFLPRGQYRGILSDGSLEQNNRYFKGGCDQGGIKATVRTIYKYNVRNKCNEISVSFMNRDGRLSRFAMLEKEFKEYNKIKQLGILNKF